VQNLIRRHFRLAIYFICCSPHLCRPSMSADCSVGR